MTDFFSSNIWNTITIFILLVLAIFTGEFVTFAMLGFILVSLSNIHSVLKEISRKLDAR